jgi:hypothetical protein
MVTNQTSSSKQHGPLGIALNSYEVALNSNSKLARSKCVGIGVRFPGSVFSAISLRNLLSAKTDAIVEIAASRIVLGRYMDVLAATSERTRWGAFHEGLVQFGLRENLFQLEAVANAWFSGISRVFARCHFYLDTRREAMVACRIAPIFANVEVEA